MRNKTYYPIICLVQLNIDNNIFIIDPILHKELNYNFLGKLLADDKIIKIFHDARQDVEVLFKFTRAKINNIFDTQVACGFCNLNWPIGYKNALQQLLDVSINKSNQFSRWDLRPLQPNQYHYAKNDVYYLLQLYNKLINKLNQNKTSAWFKEEMNNYLQHTTELSHIELINGDPELSYITYKLKLWVNDYAAKNNIPKTFVLKNHQILNIAINKPNTSTLDKYLLNTNGIKQKNKIDLINTIDNAIQHFHDHKANIEFVDSNLPDKKYNTLSILNDWLNKIAKKHGIANAIIANKKDLCLFINDKSVKFLKGWRKEIFGNIAQDIIKNQK